jgi:acyl-CoA thioesterase FadM
MKLKELLDRITELSTAERDVQLEQRKLLKTTLKQLRNKYRELEENINNEDDEELRRELEEKLNIVSTQRSKGLALLKELKNSTETS